VTRLERPAPCINTSRFWYGVITWCCFTMVCPMTPRTDVPLLCLLLNLKTLSGLYLPRVKNDNHNNNDNNDNAVTSWMVATSEIRAICYMRVHNTAKHVAVGLVKTMVQPSWISDIAKILFSLQQLLWTKTALRGRRGRRRCAVNWSAKSSVDVGCCARTDGRSMDDGSPWLRIQSARSPDARVNRATRAGARRALFVSTFAD